MTNDTYERDTNVSLVMADERIALYQSGDGLLFAVPIDPVARGAVAHAGPTGTWRASALRRLREICDGVARTA